ncbi:MAG: cupin domain-containing protein [Vicinamibacterales bacterium]
MRLLEGGQARPRRHHATPARLRLDRRPYASGWLNTLLQIAAVESGRTVPGAENVLARLSELTFVGAIRRYLAALPDAGGLPARRAAALAAIVSFASHTDGPGDMRGRQEPHNGLSVHRAETLMSPVVIRHDSSAPLLR